MIKTIDGVYPIKIIGVSGGVISLNRGQGGGLTAGDLLEVFSVGEAMLDPDTGETLGFEETKLGSLRVSEVLSRFSKATFADEPREFPKGAICRRAPQPPTSRPNAPRTRPPGW